jgi:hypothetical protein
VLAEWALALVNKHLPDFKTDALYQHAPALRTVGVLCGVTRHVADVDIMQTLGKGYIPGAFQGGNGRDRQILQQVVGVKLREM